MANKEISTASSWFIALGQLLLLGGIGVGLLWSLQVWNEHHREAASQRVRAVLQEQADAWNKGDLERFMDYYDDDLVFYTGGNILTGREQLTTRYRQRYQKDGKEMGQLTFRDVEAMALNGDSVLARGRWKVVMKDGSTPEGLFTLVLKRSHGGWKIIHDHTSATEPPKPS